MRIWAVDFQDSGEKCRKYHQSCILPVQTNILPKNFLEKKNSTHANFQGKSLRISAGKSLEEISEGTNVAKKGSSNHLLTLGEKFQTFLQKFPAVLSKQHSTNPEDEIQERKCFWKYRNLQFSPTSRRTFRTVSDKFLAGFPFMQFAYPKAGFGRDSCLESGHHNYGLQAIKVEGFFRKKRQGSQKRIPCVKMILLEKHTFRNFHLFLYFWTISKNFFQTFGRKFKGRVAETALYGFRNIQRIKTFPSEIYFPISFWLWADDFRASGQKVRKVN